MTWVQRLRRVSLICLANLAWAVCWIAVVAWTGTPGWLLFLVFGFYPAARMQKDAVATLLWVLMTAFWMLPVFEYVNPLGPAPEEIVSVSGEIVSIATSGSVRHVDMTVGRDKRLRFVIAANDRFAKLAQVRTPTRGVAGVWRREWNDERQGLWYLMVNGQPVVDRRDEAKEGESLVRIVRLAGAVIGLLWFALFAVRVAVSGYPTHKHHPARPINPPPP